MFLSISAVAGFDRPTKFLTELPPLAGCADEFAGNLSGFVGPYSIGLLNSGNGDFRRGLLLLAIVPVAGMALALRLRHAAVLRDTT